MHVAICCVTCRRPEGLRRVIEAFDGLTFRKNPEPSITVIVVDNDSAAPMRAWIDSERPGFR